jgi:putative transposase
MARIPRSFLVDLGSTNHCTFRSHNQMPLFDPETAEVFLGLMGKYKQRYGILIHSYCLMSTHPHVVLSSTKGQQSFSAFWKSVNQGIARYFNKKNNRKGQVVMERLRSPMIAPDGRHCLTVMRYGDLNPVRAGLVKSPKDWKFSSYRHYAFGEKNTLIDDAPDYIALGSNFVQRRRAYQNFFAQKLVLPLLARQPYLATGPFIGNGSWVSDRLMGIGRIPRPEG